jgi:heme-degrading monooxygenase HmoA
MIARTWQGAVRREDGDVYSDYLHETGVADYAATEGNRGVWMLRQDDGELTRFLMFTLWDSMEAVRRFAGDDAETGVFYPQDDRYLVERDHTASHWTVAEQVLPPVS